MSGSTQCLVIVVTHIKKVNQLEDVIRCILFVEYRNIRFSLQLGEVFGIIQEYRFNRSHYACLNFFQESADCIAVHHDRSDFRLRHLLLIRVFALLLVDNGIVIIFQIFVGKSYDVIFCQFRHAVESSHFIRPVATVYE